MSISEQIEDLVKREVSRRSQSVQLIASENISSRRVLSASGSLLSWKTGEGRPGRRFHSGCEVIDEVEEIAIGAAKSAFGSKEAWVQPLSCSLANLEAFLAIKRSLGPSFGGMRVLALGLAQGGHLSHGTMSHISRELFSVVEEITLDSKTLEIDVSSLRQRAVILSPHLIISGGSSYPRNFPFESIGQIAREVGAYHLADISHISGLVSAGVHPSPLPHAHLVTLSTYKAGGPRGGLILAGELANEELIAKVGGAVFPGVQGTADFGNIAAKAVLFDEMSSNAYKKTQSSIVKNAKHLASYLSESGFEVVTGGTDTHMVLLDLQRSRGLAGNVAEDRLAAAGIFANRNLVPLDPLPASITSGIRLGTNTVTRQGMGYTEMATLARLISESITGVQLNQIRREVAELASSFEVYPLD